MRGIHLEEVGGGLIFRTNPVYGPFVRDAAAKKPVRMTRAQIETLAIIAYRQPITRPEVDDVRGVDSGPVMKMLLDRGLIKILGKKDEPGRPLLYGTTANFLEFFGLRSLKDLPSLREFTELSEDSRRAFDREMAASVLVDAAPGVISLGHEVLDAAVGVAPADDDPPRLVGPQLRPVELAAVPAQHLVAELDPALVQQEIGRDRGSPGAVGSGFQGAPAIFTVGIQPIKA